MDFREKDINDIFKKLIREKYESYCVEYQTLKEYK